MPEYRNDAAVWIKKDKNGKSFISFKAERDIKAGENINIFKNDKGDNPNRPDYRAYTKLEDEITEEDTRKVLDANKVAQEAADSADQNIPF